jgi:hypothetical protein
VSGSLAFAGQSLPQAIASANTFPQYTPPHNMALFAFVGSDILLQERREAYRDDVHDRGNDRKHAHP